ncbi:MAG: indole-3-glycerol phosphate synthase TrpC [Ignavibacteriae bacterium]|nr:indole-3-glycerol phosphate synthase TrpC [Ignavibacteriota bacterium]
MNILEKIIEHKREEVARRRQKIKISDLSDMESFERDPLSLRDALQSQKVFGIIAEIKRSSPSAGILRTNSKPVDIAQDYTENGAAAISVLTDEPFFSGTLDDLCYVRQVAQIPLLRKDFIIHEYQAFEAKAYGADALLLIAGILERTQLRDLHAAASELGLECLVELYEEKEVDKIAFDEMKLVGINNRDLRTFEVDLNRSITMAQHLPDDITLVSESGISSPNDLQRLKQVGIKAALIGEHFMKAEQPGKELKKLLESLTNETTS